MRTPASPAASARTTTRPPRGGRVVVRAEAAGEAGVRISVQDTGIGIAAEDLERLARPFEQIESQHAKTQQGTGLGLALSKALLEMQGGALALESAPGRGTTASFCLPLRGQGSVGEAGLVRTGAAA